MDPFLEELTSACSKWLWNFSIWCTIQLWSASNRTLVLKYIQIINIKIKIKLKRKFQSWRRVLNQNRKLDWIFNRNLNWITYTVSGPLAKWYVTKMMPFILYFIQKPVRIELFRIRIIIGIMVEAIRWYEDHSSCRNNAVGIRNFVWFCTFPI